MRTFTFILLFCAAFAAYAHDSDHFIRNDYELVPWCRSEAEYRYLVQNIATYQWSASYYSKGNILYVNGRLRAHDEDIRVNCRIVIGAREEDAIIEIDDPLLPPPTIIVPSSGVNIIIR